MGTAVSNHDVRLLELPNADLPITPGMVNQLHL